MININPVFVKTPAISWGKLTTSNTAKDGTGIVTTIFTAEVDGSRVDKIVFQPLGTNVATVVRIFLNNGADNATATNNTYIGDLALASSSASETLEMPKSEYQFPDGLFLPAGYKINVVIGTTVAAGIQATAFGGHLS